MFVFFKCFFEIDTAEFVIFIFIMCHSTSYIQVIGARQAISFKYGGSILTKISHTFVSSIFEWETKKRDNKN
jgi:hypothetical protein